jgi:Uma2 family endonuclease
MTPTVPPELDLARIRFFYEWAEQRYLRSLPLEHFMEATAQGTQREITLESFALVKVYRPDVQCFNELLVQYPRPGHDPEKPGQVVPDNMIVIHPQPIKADGSFNTPLQPAKPFMMLEYVSKYNKRKDYDLNYDRYEKELQVPYYLLFYPDADEMSLFRLVDGKYVAVRPNESGRCPIPELELEVALLDKWVRFWFRGDLLPLPGDLLRQLNSVRDQLGSERQARQAAEDRASKAETESARLREELARLKAQP